MFHLLFHLFSTFWVCLFLPLPFGSFWHYLFFYFFFHAYLRLHCGNPVEGMGGRRLARTGTSPRASASSSGKSGTASSPLTSPASGSSCREVAYARWAATASSAAHRATQAACAAGRRWAGTAAARCRASRHKKVAASSPKRPPTSMPMTTRRQRRAHFAPRSIVRGPSRLCVSSGVRLPKPRHGRDYGGIEGEL